MSLKIDRVQLEIVIGNDQARKRMREIDDEIRNLNTQVRKMKKEGADTSAQEARIKTLRIEYDKLTDQIGLTGLSLRELRNRQRELNAILQQTPGDSPLYKQYKKQLDDVNNRMRELRGNAKQTESTLSKFANGFNKFLPLIASFAASITGTVLTFRRLAEEVAQMDDIYSDVMKTTGLTRDEVLSLNEEFKKLNTRTSREELNLLARDAGKLGLSARKDVLDFVEAGNQINVALGEDLGEGAIREIGKITEVFRLSTKELDELDLKGRMLSVGSAINELGSSSTANEAYLVNFTQRLGGVASQAGISVQSILGYAAALDQSGQAVEMSATALQRFIMSIMGDPVKFAQIAGVEVKKFSDLLSSDANEAIKMVLRSLSEQGGFQQLIPIFQEMGLDGARAVGVLSALATNIEKVDEAQRISNEAFSEATSLTDEYNVKNENMMARLEKARQKFQEARLELGERLNPALLQSTNIMTYLIRILPDVFNWFEKYGGILIRVTALILAYNAGIKAQTLWTKLALVEKTKLVAANIRETASMIALNLRYIAGSRSIGDFNKSMKALWATMKMNLWGAVIAGLTAVGFLIYELIKRNRQFTNQAEAMVEVNKKIADSVGRERGELEQLLRIARNETISKEEREKAIRRLNEISPQYLGNLSLENINTQAATDAVKEYTEALMQNAREKAVSEKISELYAKQMELEMKVADENRKIEADKAKGFWKSNKLLQSAYQVRLNNFEKEKKIVTQQIEAYQKLGETLIKNRKDTGGNIIVDEDPDIIVGGYTPNSDNDTNNKNKKDVMKSREESLREQYRRDLLLFKQSLLDKQISEEEYNKLAYQLDLDLLKLRRALYEEFGEDTTEIDLEITDKTIAEVNRRHKLQQEEVKKNEQEIAAIQKDAEETKAKEEEQRLKDAEDRIRHVMESIAQGHEHLFELLFELNNEWLNDFLEKHGVAASRIAETGNNILMTAANFNKAEEMAVERRYNKMIKAAGNNSRKVQQLEEEKEKKLHEVRAKYADKQFIITVAQVIASTAVSAMEAFKAMAGIPVVGPALGAVAAAAAVAYGASQIAVAKQQRDAAKEGYRTGGYTGQGDDRDEAGIVHRNEFVNTADAVRNPHVKRFLDVFDVAQKNGTIRMLNTSQILERAKLGITSPSRQQPVYNSPSPEPDLVTIDTLNRLRDSVDRFTEKLDIPIKTYTVIHGTKGARRQNELYDRIMKNARL